MLRWLHRTPQPLSLARPGPPPAQPLCPPQDLLPCLGSGAGHRVLTWESSQGPWARTTRWHRDCTVPLCPGGSLRCVALLRHACSVSKSEMPSFHKHSWRRVRHGRPFLKN